MSQWKDICKIDDRLCTHRVRQGTALLRLFQHSGGNRLMKLDNQHLRLRISNHRAFHFRHRTTVKQSQQPFRYPCLHRVHHWRKHQTTQYFQRLCALDLATAGVKRGANTVDNISIADHCTNTLWPK